MAPKTRTAHLGPDGTFSGGDAGAGTSAQGVVPPPQASSHEAAGTTLENETAPPVELEDRSTLDRERRDLAAREARVIASEAALEAQRTAIAAAQLSHDLIVPQGDHPSHHAEAQVPLSPNLQQRLSAVPDQVQTSVHNSPQGTRVAAVLARLGRPPGMPLPHPDRLAMPPPGIEPRHYTPQE